MKNRRTLTIICVALSVCLLISAVAMTLAGNLGNGAGTGGSARNADSYKDIYDIIKKLDSNSYDGFIFKGEEANLTFAASASPVAADDMAVNEVTSDAASTDGGYSATNNQVEGVDEGDILKTDGKYIYMLRGGYLTIVDAESLKELCCVDMTGDGTDVREMFLKGDRLCVISSSYPYYIFSKYGSNAEERINNVCGTTMTVYDITDRTKPKKLNTLTQTGSYVSARMTGDIIYTVSTDNVFPGDIIFAKPETYVPCVAVNGQTTPVSSTDICIMTDPNTAAYTVVTSMSITSGDRFDSSKAAFGGCGTVYANTSSLVVACSKQETKEEKTVTDGKNAVVQTTHSSTEIILFTLDNGKISPKAQGSIPGELINQFAIDEYNGYYRFVTTDNAWVNTIFTDGIDTYDYKSSSTSGLYVLDDTLNIVGKIDGLADGERVQSVRFYGDVGYFVTFRQVDPLFSVDLSSPTSPKILSTLKIPGFSSYMHAFGEGRLFGLGYDADEESGMTQGLKLSMFDVSDPSNVSEKHKLLLDEDWSVATYDHKAILISTEKNIIAFPADDGYLIYGYDDNSGFFKKNKAEIKDWSAYDSRGLFIGDKFYVCSDDEVRAFEMGGFKCIGKVELNIPAREANMFIDEAYFVDDDE